MFFLVVKTLLYCLQKTVILRVDLISLRCTINSGSSNLESDGPELLFVLIPCILLFFFGTILVRF